MAFMSPDDQGSPVQVLRNRAASLRKTASMCVAEAKEYAKCLKDARIRAQKLYEAARAMEESAEKLRSSHEK